MAELGPDGPGYHHEAAAHARRLGIDPIVGVGELAREYAADEWVPDPAAAAAVVAGILGEGDAVLVKGSRSVGLEAFADALLRERERREPDVLSPTSATSPRGRSTAARC